MSFLPRYRVSLLLTALLACSLPVWAQADGPDRLPISEPVIVGNVGDYKKNLAQAELDQGGLLSKQQLVERLLILVPGGRDDPAVSENFLVTTKLGILAYPRAFLCLLLKHNCHVYVAPFVVRADASLEGRHPDGYPPESSYLNCRAVFTTKGILIGSCFYKGGKLMPNLDPLHGVEHEMAHAIDQNLGRPSLSDKFLEIYKLEAAAISVTDRAPLAYYLEGGRVGPIETFGQLLAHKYCHFTEHHTLSLVRCFPHCVQFIDEHFPSAEHDRAVEVK
jgi:hypothetical protein